jgi:glycosyltransferase involved in cell wall biosynthesis
VAEQAEPLRARAPEQKDHFAGPRDSLRVAFVVGTLVQDGAEKQLVYMARALQEVGVRVRIFCLTQGEFYEEALTQLGLRPVWIGSSRSRLLRLFKLTMALRAFRPHIIQSAHFFTNLYAALPARWCGATAVGCSRNDVFSELADCKRLGTWSLQFAPSLVVNSHAARRNAESLGVHPDVIQVLGNVIDLAEFDKRSQATTCSTTHGSPLALAVGRLVPQKRFDRFLVALAKARQTVSTLRGALVGEGPEDDGLKRRARSLGLTPEHVEFLGRRNDVPALLKQAAMLVLTSDYEGFPNVILEAMAAALPVITTPAGDAASVVQDGVTGSVVPFDDVDGLAQRMVRLAREAPLRKQYGHAARCRVVQHYACDGLAARLLEIYRTMARQQGRRALLNVLAEYS